MPAEKVRRKAGLVLLGLSPVADLHGRRGENRRLLGGLAAGRQPRQRGDQRRPLEPQLAHHARA
eukprot:1899314-Lingulodinium_polyedra.AAC.1